MPTSRERPARMIRGAAGFLGSYLAEVLLEKGFTVYGILYRDTPSVAHPKERMASLACGILHSGQVEAAVLKGPAELVFRVAAHGFPVLSAKTRRAPWRSFALRAATCWKRFSMEQQLPARAHKGGLRVKKETVHSSDARIAGTSKTGGTKQAFAD